jgi:ribosome-associated toxin RatA of RatAB toxin-antitoxin module
MPAGRYGRAMTKGAGLAIAGLGVGLLLAGCGQKGVDWSAKENVLMREETAQKDGGVELQYWSLIDSACKPIFDALADVEHYRDFIPGVDSTSLLGATGDTKTVLIAQRVIGRQNNAKVEWKFDAAKPRIEFKTLASDFSFNTGYYDFEASPDGKRCLLHTVFLVKQKEGTGEMVAESTLAQATRDGYVAAATAVKKRATGAK